MAFISRSERVRLHKKICSKGQLKRTRKRIECRPVILPALEIPSRIILTHKRSETRSVFLKQVFIVNLKSICMKSNSSNLNYFTLAACAIVCILAISCQKSIERSTSSDQSIPGKNPQSLMNFEQVNLVG